MTKSWGIRLAAKLKFWRSQNNGAVSDPIPDDETSEKLWSDPRTEYASTLGILTDQKIETESSPTAVGVDPEPTEPVEERAAPATLTSEEPTGREPSQNPNGPNASIADGNLGSAHAVPAPRRKRNPSAKSKNDRSVEQADANLKTRLTRQNAAITTERNKRRSVRNNPSSEKNAASYDVFLSSQARLHPRKQMKATERVTDEELSALEAENVRLKFLLAKRSEERQKPSINQMGSEND